MGGGPGKVNAGAGQPGPEGQQDDRLLGLEAEDVLHRGEQLVRGLNDEIHRSQPPQLAWAACGARSMRADKYLSEMPTSPQRLSTNTTGSDKILVGNAWLGRSRYFS